MERRLTAILAADVVGYSRLMGEDEVGTLERLKTCRRELVDHAARSQHARRPQDERSAPSAVGVRPYEAANVMLTRYKGQLKLKDWAFAIAKRSTMRKARVALRRAIS
jgi:hypothetical protein